MSEEPPESPSTLVMMIPLLCLVGLSLLAILLRELWIWLTK